MELVEAEVIDAFPHTCTQYASPGRNSVQSGAMTAGFHAINVLTVMPNLSAML